MDTLTLYKIKQALRRTHDKLDEDLQADIEACMADLKVAGVIYADHTDPLVFNAIKLWCKANNTDDVIKSAEYMKRYTALKSSLMMAEGYGIPREAGDE